uniref:Protein-tyrosine-phosphatase n=1 Tax=Steinernema glaseri TaxID=37863 RepID=A0A1I8A1T6_9BILA
MIHSLLSRVGPQSQWCDDRCPKLVACYGSTTQTAHGLRGLYLGASLFFCGVDRVHVCSTVPVCLSEQHTLMSPLEEGEEALLRRQAPSKQGRWSLLSPQTCETIAISIFVLLST